MSESDFRIGPGVPAPTPPPPATQAASAPPPKRGSLPFVLVAVAALVVGLCVGFGAGMLVGSADTPNAQAATSGSPVAKIPSKSPSPAGPVYDEPTKEAFALTVKILEKKCFGSAGCNLNYRIELVFVSSIRLDPSKEYELTYEVRGGEDPQIGTLKITGTQYSVPEQEFISTKSSSAVLTAVATGIDGR